MNDRFSSDLHLGKWKLLKSLDKKVKPAPQLSKTHKNPEILRSEVNI